MIQTGIGPANAQAVCRAVVAQRPWTVCVASGYAGALVPAHIGDLVIPESVLDRVPDPTGVVPDSSLACNTFYRQTAQDVAQSSRCAVVAGRVVTVQTMVCLAMEKRVIGRACGVSGLDMESAMIGAVAAQHGVPFFVVRSISDLAEEDLPDVLHLLCRPATLLQGVWAVVVTPRLWPVLNRLRRQKNVASSRLARFFEAFFSRLSNMRCADEFS